MKTIKIIDLLNKIANGEENDTLTEFVFDSKVWNFYKLNHSEFCLDGWLLNQEIKITKSFNDEEDEFEDITGWGKPALEELQTQDIKLRDLQSYMYLLAKDQNTLIENQKKIIERIND